MDVGVNVGEGRCVGERECVYYMKVRMIRKAWGREEARGNEEVGCISRKVSVDDGRDGRKRRVCVVDS